MSGFSSRQKSLYPWRTQNLDEHRPAYLEGDDVDFPSNGDDLVSVSFNQCDVKAMVSDLKADITGDVAPWEPYDIVNPLRNNRKTEMTDTVAG